MKRIYNLLLEGCSWCKRQTACFRRTTLSKKHGRTPQFDFDRYHDYYEMKRYMLSVAAMNPEFVRLRDIGTTHEGRRLLGLKAHVFFIKTLTLTSKLWRSFKHSSYPINFSVSLSVLLTSGVEIVFRNVFVNGARSIFSQ